MYVTITRCNGKPFEVFTHLGKTGGCAAAQTEAVCRCLSSALRSGEDVAPLVDQLIGIKCPAQVPEADSCADAIGRILKQEMEQNGSVKKEEAKHE
jgi:ribonucleoside-diphosphate reductase alpha chain